MKVGTSKAKGADYERKICQKLSLWVSNLTREDIYWRAAMSGGRAKFATRKGKTLEAQAGDISAVHPMGAPLLSLFVLECKFYADLCWRDVINEKTWKIRDEWNKLLEDCKIGSQLRQPLMIARENRQKDVVITSAVGLKLLERGHKGPIAPSFIFPREDMCGFLLSYMLTNVDPNQVCGTCIPSSTPPISTRRRVLLTDTDGESLSG